MIQLSSAELLFQNQKVYKVGVSMTPVAATEKKILLVYESAQEQLPVNQKEMLEKLTAACKFKPDEVGHLNTRFTTGSLADWKNNFHPAYILAFGAINISRNLPLLKKNHPYCIDSIQLLQTETLDKLSGNDKEKGALWLALKKMLKL